MFYQLPITKEEILSFTKGELEWDYDTWVDGVVYYEKEDDLHKYHINEDARTITICIPTEHLYLDYDMNTKNLKSIIYTSTCWSDDLTRYDFDEKGELFYIEDTSHGGNRRTYVTLKDNVITKVEKGYSKSNYYQEGAVLVPKKMFEDVFQYFNDYLN